MQAGVHLQLLVGAVGMERKMNSSVGLGRRWRHRWVGREYLETTLSKPRPGGSSIQTHIEIGTKGFTRTFGV